MNATVPNVFPFLNSSAPVINWAKPPTANAKGTTAGIASFGRTPALMHDKTTVVTPKAASPSGAGFATFGMLGGTSNVGFAIEAIGYVSVELWVRAGLLHFDVFARVCDVDPAGVSRNVCDALTGVAPDRYEQAADGTWRVRFRLWPMGHRFAPGHRVRLLIASGAHPRYARNPGTGEDPAAATAATMRPVDIEVLHDAAHPSALVLPAQPR